MPLPIPYNLTAVAFNGKATLRWQIERSPSQPLAGYNIYCQSPYKIDTSFAAQPYNHAPYPGDTDGDIKKESLELSGLENGREYVAFIRTVGTANNLSGISNFCRFTPALKGEFTISTDHLGENGGYCFEKMKSTAARDPENDIYLYATADRIGLSSPHRLGAGLRRTFFNSPIISTAAMETVPIRRGDSIWIQTKAGIWDLEIVKIENNDGRVQATIRFISQKIYK